MVGACVAGGHPWHGGGEGGLRGRRDGHCSGRYTSYWNAFLLGNIFSNYKQMLTM